MGCWYSTCHMSNLPILGGEKVVAILLAPKFTPRHQLACHPDDYFSAIGSPIIGEYDEYGGLKTISMSPTMENYLKDFAKKHVFERQGNDGSYDYGKYEWTDIDTFIDDWLGYELYVECPSEMRMLEYVLVHKELYDLLIKNVSSRIPYGKTNTYAELLGKKIERSVNWTIQHNQMYRDMLREMSNDKISEEELGSTFYYRLSSSLHQVNDWYWRSMDEFAKEYEQTKNNAILSEIRECILWHEVMSLSRKGYFCTSGGGSQSQEMMMHKLIAEFILKKCQKVQGRKKKCVLEDTIFLCE